MNNSIDKSGVELITDPPMSRADAKRLCGRSNYRPYTQDFDELHRLVLDQVGTVRLVVDAATGAVVERTDLDEYGKAPEGANPERLTPFGFAGGLSSIDSGLVHFAARDYDPGSGRWTTKDPILFRGGSTGLYLYSGASPVELSDPTGLTVDCYYSISGGKVGCIDRDTGKLGGGIDAESGNKPYGAPIPVGDYEILSQDRKPGFFRLDSIDANPRDDVDQNTGRDRFRLHRPGLTVGCVAAKDKDDWDELESFIRRTSTFSVRDMARTPIYSPSHWSHIPRWVTYYGVMHVRP